MTSTIEHKYINFYQNDCDDPVVDIWDDPESARAECRRDIRRAVKGQERSDKLAEFRQGTGVSIQEISIKTLMCQYHPSPSAKRKPDGRDATCRVQVSYDVKRVEAQIAVDQFWNTIYPILSQYDPMLDGNDLGFEYRDSIDDSGKEVSELSLDICEYGPAISREIEMQDFTDQLGEEIKKSLEVFSSRFTISIEGNFAEPDPDFSTYLTSASQSLSP